MSQELPISIDYLEECRHALRNRLKFLTWALNQNDLLPGMGEILTNEYQEAWLELGKVSGLLLHSTPY